MIFQGGRSLLGLVIARSSAPASTLAWAMGRRASGTRASTWASASGRAESAR